MQAFKKIIAATRISSWRLSFVPFIMGLVYLWLIIFDIPFNFYYTSILGLSILTTIGFASFGFVTNEYFDIKDDAIAGKKNKFVGVQPVWFVMLIMVSLVFALLPWIWLPKNHLTYYLISAEFFLLLAYSLPLIKLKKVYWISGIIDSAYAYVIPILLSLHTYCLLMNQVLPITTYLLLSILCFLIGFRNILIHQVNDILADKRSNINTLVRKLTPEQVSKMIITLQILEAFYFLALFILLFKTNPFLFSIPLLYIIVLLSKLNQNKNQLTLEFYSLKSLRHLADSFYQIWMPILLILILSTQSIFWLTILPFHLLLFVGVDKWKKGIEVTQRAWHNQIRNIISVCINYPLFIFFLLFGINLKKENKSAKEYLNSRKK